MGLLNEPRLNVTSLGSLNVVTASLHAHASFGKLTESLQLLCTELGAVNNINPTSPQKNRERHNLDPPSVHHLAQECHINNSIRIKVESDKCQPELEITFCRISKEKERQ